MARRKSPMPPRRRSWVAPAAVALLAVAVYGNAFSNGFIGDDKIQLLKNPLLASVSNIPLLFRSSVWSILGIPGNYYRPFQFLVYTLVYQCAGFSAAAFHTLMIAVHAANAVLLYLLVRRMAGPRVAVAAAALFAVHPIHTETVNWIAAVPDLTVTTFALTGVLWFARQEGAPRRFAIAGHCVLYLLALLAKETGVMLLPLYGGYGFFCLGRRWKELRFNAALYAAMAGTFVLYLALRLNALGGLAPGQQSFFHLTPVEFALSVVVTAAQYLGALLWPANLNYFHIFHPAASLCAVVVLSALALAAVGAAFFRFRAPLFSYGVFWIAVTLAPALNLTGVGQNVFAERYLYLPSAGFCWIAALAWNWMFERRRVPAWVAAGAVLLAAGAATMARNADWRDDATLLDVTLRQSPESGWLHNSMAGVYIERNQFGAALAEERLAVRYEPRSPVFRRNLANILLTKDPHEAVGEFRELVAIEPNRAENHCDLALALEAAGERTQAAAEYQRALQLQPQSRDAQAGYLRTSSAVR
jgi:tetratricopeptide (TPR) repeat protein